MGSSGAFCMAPTFLISLFCALQCAIAAEEVRIEIRPAHDRILLNHSTRLDIQVKDVTNVSVPWEDLLVHHARKVHLYALHEVSFF
jgi:hypothetical protein